MNFPAYVLYATTLVMTLGLVGFLARRIHRSFGPLVAVLTFIGLAPVAFAALVGVAAVVMMVSGTSLSDALR